MAISSERSRQRIGALYQAIQAGDVSAVLDMLDPTLQASVPPLLPFGGEFKGLDAFLKGNLPIASAMLDFSKLQVEKLVADGADVVATVTAGLQGSMTRVRISEHWTLDENEKIVRLDVFYFDPRPVLELIN